MKRFLAAALICMAALVSVPAMAAAWTPPVLTSPANGATVANSDGLGGQPHFYWTEQDTGTTFNVLVATQPNRDSNRYFTSGTVVDVLTNYTDYNAASPNNGNNPWHLSPGTYYWCVREEAFDTQVGTHVVSWSEVRSFTVPSPTLTMVLSTSRIDWSWKQGSASPSGQSLDINTDPSGPAYWWSLDGVDPPWLTVTQPSSSRLTFTPNITGLAPGTYTTTYTVSVWSDAANTHPALGSPRSFPIKLVVMSQFYLPPITPIVVLPIKVSATSPAVSGSANHTKKTLFKGSVSPHFSTKVTITIERQVQGKWKAYKKVVTKTAASNGQWSFKLKLPKGKFRLKAASSSYGLYLAAQSSWRTVKIK